jgi:hypothetical protein
LPLPDRQQQQPYNAVLPFLRLFSSPYPYLHESRYRSLRICFNRIIFGCGDVLRDLHKDLKHRNDGSSTLRYILLKQTIKAI